jgi:teichuronic acid biosynthesis glycosyltransferase TuaH
VNILFLSHTARNPIVVVGSHHLSAQLARGGDNVTHVSNPLTPAHLLRVKDAVVRARLAAAVRPPPASPARPRDVVPVTLLPVGSSQLTDKWLARRISAAAPRSGWDFALVDQPRFASLVQQLPVRAVVYRPTDAHPGGKARAAERALLAVAAGIVATSHQVLTELPDHPRTPTRVLENGVDLDHFARRRQRGEGVVYAGVIDHRFDWRSTVALAQSFPEERVTLVGPVHVRPPVMLPANVHVLGPVPYDDLPEILAQHHIGVLPFNEAPGNAGRSPMKFFEYLSAGLHVLATRTVALSDRKPAPGVILCKSTEEFVAGAEALLAAGDYNRAGPAAAAAFDWSARAAELRHFLRKLSGPDGAEGGGT